MKSFGRVGAAILAGAVAGIVGTSSANADVIYTYTGQDFTTVTSPYTTSNSVTGWITLPGPLGDNLNDEAVTPLSFSFTDGAQTIDNTANSFGFDLFNFWTNASGVITRWQVDVFSLSSTVFDAVWTNTVSSSAFIPGDQGTLATCYAGSSTPGSCTVNTLDYGVTFEPGSWSVTRTAVPEPLTLSLFGASLAGAAAAARRRRKANKEA